ncbi:MAG: GntR family transcriptional regulator [Sporomusaceae bacterium]|jgi:DNA-binding GntR family transcriptional regulator|nr:GntR family transcriptional regulator [Sporomusaceae bacterium]
MRNKAEKLVSSKQKIYASLKNSIIDQRFKPGEMLNERKLAQEMGVSRTPVREALRVLESEGLVLIAPYKGIYVSEITERQVQEVFQVRATLECLVVELALNNITPFHLKELGALLQKQAELAEQQQPAEFIRIDMAFHAALCDIAGNLELNRLLASLESTIRRLSVQAVQKPYRYQATLAEHKAILHSLAVHSYELSAAAVKEHVSRTEASLRSQLSENSNQKIKEETL